MKRRAFLLSLAAALALAPRGRLSAQDVLDIVLTEIEKRLIDAYYRDQYDRWVAGGGNPNGKHKNKDLPPGLAKKGGLPPGLYKQLVRNGQLPPGLQGRDLPNDLAGQLPSRPADQRIVILEDRVLLIQAATNLILDVLTVAAVEAID